uniref:Large ribosomal subunit protein mL44 n=1 Tax=Phallusia mammillata TaxID=59560 RepID=A0A6F9DLB8_9ASCI|nr:39S ribosomal protein L44, mitochondrial-like [Phallusia mammillata]
MLNMRRMIRLQFPLCKQMLASPTQGTRKYTSKPGNPQLEPVNKNSIMFARWKKHWYLSMARKKNIEGEEPEEPRSTRENWNYEAEFAAFKLRLQIDVADDDLRAAFTQPLPERDDVVDYSSLCTKGNILIHEFVKHYINLSFPKLCDEGKSTILDYLCSTKQLAHIAFNLGYKDFIQCSPFPPSSEVFAESFQASIEAIAKGSGGPVAAGKFILDFIIPQLIGKDILHDIWKPENPMKILTQELQNQGKPGPEARLVRQSGISSTLPVFFIALYSGKEFLTEGAGESIELAETDAAKLVLKRIYGVEPNSRAIMMGVVVDDEFLEKLFAPLMQQRQQITGSG